ncbi:MAG: hypothetical protein O3A53_14815 [Acidobacteria bacterium]|nr:hypothetical protein [Acidobacteriota bacterium]MDA1236057.1 hypothetical protein [Acidobacteriota bacterium]
MADIINDNGTIEVDLGVFFAEVTDLRIETRTLSTGETGENVFATIRFRHPKTGEDCGVSMRATCWQTAPHHILKASNEALLRQNIKGMYGGKKR